MNKKMFLPLISSLLVMFTITAGMAEPFLRIVQPFENYDIPPVDQSFVFGSVLPATATLKINGTTVTPHANGGFLTMIPFQKGRFKIQAVATDGVNTSTVTRMVNVAESGETYSLTYSKIRPITPTTRVVYRPGDVLELMFQGAPEGAATFRMGGRGTAYPMYEQPGQVRGIYRGAYTIQSDDKYDGSDILFSLRRSDGKKINKKAGARIIVQRRKLPRYVETTDQAVLLTGPGSTFGYHMFLEKDIQLEVTGEWGDFLRVELSPETQGWIKKSVARALPPGTPPLRTISRNMRIDVYNGSTILELPLKNRHAYKIQQTIEPNRFKLTLYGITPDTDRIRYKSVKSVVKEVTWTQTEADSVTFDIVTSQKFGWGYDARYEGTNFILEIRHKPQGYNGKGLRGLRIALDAGHTKNSFGTIGPWGNTEFEVNVMVAKVVKRILEKKGAKVLMIQDGTKEISLGDRVAQAWKNKCHLFISLHCDATGEGNDPRERQGFSVHYYHPQSRPMAEIIHRIYRKEMEVADQGLWRSNLAVCRTTHMPSILLEMAYLILPEFEELLLTKQFHSSVANVLVKSLESFMDKATK